MASLILAGEAIFGLPFALARVFRPTVLDVFGLTNLQLGAAFSLYGTVAMLSYFPGGPLADRYPARRMMSVALLSTALGGVFYYTVPSLGELTLLYGFWGMTTILLFWASMMRATREWGGADGQGRAFGLLDGGRGLTAAVVATLSLGLFSVLLPADATTATLAQRSAAFQQIVLFYLALTVVAAGAVWTVVPEPASWEGASAPKMSLEGVKRLIRMPSIWLQGLIVVCAYVGYKGTDDLSLLASDVLGYDDVQAASIGALSFWIRPFAALGAGLLADRFRGSNVIIGCFAMLAVSNIAVVWLAGDASTAWLLLAAVASTSAAVYALRGVYFAVFEEAKVPLEFTGSAVGIVSVVGYTPDIFMGPLMGYILDRHPGAHGHQDLFLFLAGSAVVGLLATVAFQRSISAD